MSRTAHSAASHAGGIDFDLVATRYVAVPALLWGAAMATVVIMTAVVVAAEPVQAGAPALQQPAADETAAGFVYGA